MKHIFLIIALLIVTCTMAAPLYFHKDNVKWFESMRSCFQIKVAVAEDGRKVSCYASSTKFDDDAQQWVTTCKPLSKKKKRRSVMRRSRHEARKENKTAFHP